MFNGKECSVIGSDVGQLEIEYIFDQLLCVGKKQYIGYYTNKDGLKQTKQRFKGIPSRYITPEMYSHLIKSSDATVRVSFLKFKRLYGAVEGYIEHKTVKST
jgi:hypothetical protein